MENRITIAPSLLSCDFSAVGSSLGALSSAGFGWLHLDVMDGVFVPNISFGQVVVKSLRPSTDMFFDTHLMITQPERYIDDFVKAGSDLITVHYESTESPADVLKMIRARGIKAGLSIKPGTPFENAAPLLPLCDLFLVMTVEPGFGGQKFMPDMVSKIKAASELKKRLGLELLIEVDGGIGISTARVCAEAGADVLVAGSSVFGASDPVKAANSLIAAAKNA